jgi:DNA-binding CsgD family transcriptional regulator
VLNSDVDLDGVIAEIYSAAAGEQPWTAPLEQMVDRWRCWGVQVFGLRLADGSMAFSHDVGFPAEGMLHYVSRYHLIDPRTPMLSPLAMGEWWHCHEHFDDDFVARHPLYQELLIPYGGRYSSGVKLYQDNELLVVMGVSRGPVEGPLDGDDRIAMRRLSLHMQTAVGLWRRQRRTVQQALAGEVIVSRLSQPVLLVDSELVIHHRNAAARALMTRRVGIVERDCRLTCSDITTQGELLLAIQQLRLGGTPDASASRPHDRVVLRVGQPPGTALLLVLSSLEPHETMGAFGAQTLALVLMHDLAQRSAPDPLMVGAAFSLTPAEAQVACGVAAGRSPQQFADTTGVSVHTVRAQLSTVFQKVGVGRQAELASALAGLTPL